jgi:hypothetical protein
MASIVIGKMCFNSESLEGVTLSDAYEKFSHVRKDIVKMAHSKSNPKIKKSSKKKVEEKAD